MRRNREIGKTLAGLLILTGLGALLSGCTLSAADVKLHTKEQMQSIVDERYGDAEFVSVEENHEKHQKTFRYRDTKYGFTYEVISHPNSVGLDGSTFYYDGAGIYFKYEEPFLEYFMEQEADAFAKQGIKLCEEMDLPSNVSYPTERKFSLKEKKLTSSPDHWEGDVKFAWDRVNAYKKIPELTERYEIKVYNSEKAEYLGTLKEERFFTAEEERIEYFMYQAQSLGGISGVKFLRVEEKKISELPELADQEFYNRGVYKVKAYYFSYDDKEYYIIDQWVAQIGDNGGGIFQYYQNYKHYDVSR